MDEEIDIAIVGGGLAGLCLALQCKEAGRSVMLFEKETYPFHRVCGEYISMESWDFLQRLGADLEGMGLPKIGRLAVSDVKGNTASATLPLGGFGISRYAIDNLLHAIAVQKGVIVRTGTKVQDIGFDNGSFNITTTQGERVRAQVAAGSFGKRSNLDIKWNRGYMLEKPNKLNNYVGIKYHLRYPHPTDTIALHNFPGGYCGLSRIEDGKSCLCYLTTAKNLAQSGQSIQRMEADILWRNPRLKEIFTKGEFLFDKPVVISQVSFAKKTQTENHVLLLGDAAGSIAPLCGNGMSMAMHGSLLAFEAIECYLNNKTDCIGMEESYARCWNRTFGNRMAIGRFLQSISGKEKPTEIFVSIMRLFPFLATLLVKGTHGKGF